MYVCREDLLRMAFRCRISAGADHVLVEMVSDSQDGKERRDRGKIAVHGKTLDAALWDEAIALVEYVEQDPKRKFTVRRERGERGAFLISASAL